MTLYWFLSLVIAGAVSSALSELVSRARLKRKTSAMFNELARIAADHQVSAREYVEVFERWIG